jgi:hypothetical protein
VDAKRPVQLDLATSPSVKRFSHAIMELRRGADFPGQQGDAHKKKRNEAEEKPFPRKLARLHADPIHPFVVPAIGLADLAATIGTFLVRLTLHGERNSSIFLGYQEIRNANSAGGSDAGKGLAETAWRLPAMILCSNKTGAKLTTTMESAESPASS